MHVTVIKLISITTTSKSCDPLVKAGFTLISSFSLLAERLRKGRKDSL